MCGRFFFRLDDSDTSVFLQRLIQKKHFYEYATDEVFPSQPVLTLIWENGDYAAEVMKWGMTRKDGSLVINARMESIAEKRMFCGLQRHRCLIPCNGFYEWKRSGGKKQKIFIKKEGEGICYLAGLYNSSKEMVLLTGEAEKQLAQIHHRTPLIISAQKKLSYLNGELPLAVDNDHLLLENALQEEKECFLQTRLEL